MKTDRQRQIEAIGRRRIQDMLNYGYSFERIAEVFGMPCSKSLIYWARKNGVRKPAPTRNSAGRTIDYDREYQRPFRIVPAPKNTDELIRKARQNEKHWKY